MAGRSISC